MNKIYWVFSYFISLIFLVILLFMWYSIDSKKGNFNHIISDKQDLNSFLDEYNELYRNASSKKTYYIPTGVFVQSIYFIDPFTVSMTGYVWQKYANNIPLSIERDFTFPQVVESADTFTKDIAYKHHNKESKVIGWYFEGYFRQDFVYDDYPLDNQEVWLKITPKSFLKNVILVPDFDAYENDSFTNVFGIDQGIVLNLYSLENTYFNYKYLSYDTNFGDTNFDIQNNFPELNFNILLKRKYMNAFVIYLLPIFVVLILLFALLMTISNISHSKSLFDFSLSSLLGTAAALVFVAILSHIDLKRSMEGTSVMYLEYFYILTYLMISLVTLDAYFFSEPKFRNIKIVQYENNLIPKLLYWPLILMSLISITYFNFY